ncbi:MAG: aldolase/citrate lyase family protein [Pigmentiphaga sp.]|uniref:HpcH/HpaI aldolase family protein n=1 Tax=Pigmentiphaga sp. TaxID=1977564 RepID=UPI0029B5084F|nr:aldolase/citrate lyase family protein [Pigmentiphaga sp.]MDX3906036.1 aldolase/citrate lyase family protein [Pigmentiphaga sp.]
MTRSSSETDRPVQAGTFIKTVSPHVVEILGTTALDFGVLDAEHAPFDRTSLDLMMLAGRAARLPLYVRIPDFEPATILSTLDLGAAGIVVPHVDTAEQAALIVSRARYQGGVRGFSSSPRAAGYGTMSYQQAQEAGDQSLVLCQIESVEGLANVESIAAVPGVSGLFVGRADLSLSMGEQGSRSPAVLEATARIVRAALDAGKIAAMFVGNAAERDEFAAQGVTWFVIGSDQSLLRQGAQSVAVGAGRPRG